MPVPVPRNPKSHPVIKQNQSGPTEPFNSSVFQNLTQTLPLSPTRPPPSFGTREEWIESLPPWRRAKPRMVWDDNRTGNRVLTQQVSTIASNSLLTNSVKTYISPFSTLLVHDTLSIAASPMDPRHFPETHHGFDADADDEMSPNSSMQDSSPLRHITRWIPPSPLDNVKGRFSPRYDDCILDSPQGCAQVNIVDGRYEKGAFSPVLEDESPEILSGVEASSLYPATPFGEFVDRAVAATAQSYAGPVCVSDGESAYQDETCSSSVCQAQTCQNREVPNEPVPVESVVTPCATPAYKNLAEPLSTWVANYVWKVCTTGMSLPATYAPFSSCSQLPEATPSYLAASVHSLLLSTLLQPSAVFLAVWYIVRLPVCFGPLELESDQVKEYAFRQELLGDPHNDVDLDLIQTSAPFRVILLGCMLANKWLDDHTFSNRTWHTISNVPIRSLNRLEALALSIFEYDLSVPARAWSQWLTHVASYHKTLASPSHPQPISRPSTNPHSIVRNAIEELVESPVCCETCPAELCEGMIFEPVFLGLEERKREKRQRDHAATVDIHEIDLDKDGPLREEYLPRRRASGSSTVRSPDSQDEVCHNLPGNTQITGTCASRRVPTKRALPPPAKWSPAGDEPILRDRNRCNVQYVAVQPPVAFPVAISHYPARPDPYSGWGFSAGFYFSGNAFGAVDSRGSMGRRVLMPQQIEPAVKATGCHSRSVSLFSGQENLNPNSHLRSPSQNRHVPPRGDIRLNEHGAPYARLDSYWSDQYLYQNHYVHSFGPQPALHYQVPWIRT